MKKYDLVKTLELKTSVLYYGYTNDIKRIISSIYKATYKPCKTDLMFLFTEKPMFDNAKLVYGFTIDDENIVQVVNQDTVLHYIMQNL